MEEIIEISETKNYHAFGVYLGRRKLSNAHKLSRLLIEKFALTKKYKDWQNISADELKEKGILPCKRHSTFSQWRDAVLKAGILVCMATKEELKEEAPNYKGNMFKIGDKARKYIDIAIQENLPRKVDEIGDKVDLIGSDVEKLKSELEQTKLALKETNRKIEKVAEYVLHQNPPDTPERKQIVVDNIDNLPKALELLAQQRKLVDKNIQETGKMFN
ncbi:hypothetical protein ACWNT8_15540 (plasmid) [Pigmentibacter ruber]